jgi:hypothetical protein
MKGGCGVGERVHHDNEILVHCKILKLVSSLVFVFVFSFRYIRFFWLMISADNILHMFGIFSVIKRVGSH